MPATVHRHTLCSDKNKNCTTKNIYMQYTLSNQKPALIARTDIHTIRRESFLTRFLRWCNSQETNRFLWLGVTFFGQIGLALPVAAFSILFFGDNNFLLWIIICVVNLPTLVLNLAALPTKITLPFLFFAWLTEAAVVLYCVAFALSH